MPENNKPRIPRSPSIRPEGRVPLNEGDFSNRSKSNPVPTKSIKSDPKPSPAKE